MKAAGFIFDHSPHYLDHLAPFCALMDWPLIVCDDAIAELCKKYYPQVKLIESDFFKLDLPPCIVSCYPKPMIQAALGIFRPYAGKVLWLPHGLSDKGWKSPFFEALKEEDFLLVYGQRMRDVLEAKNVSIPQISVGNFREEFYKKNKSFYDAFIPGTSRFILYAPTWEDSEDNGTLWTVLPKLAEAEFLRENLRIKLHPNTERKYERQLDKLKNQFTFIENMPPVHPLLNRADAYIGDMSSIGYDFLSYNKPLYFLRKEFTNPLKDPSAFLLQAGRQISIEELSLIGKDTNPVNHEKIYRYAFDELQDRIRKLVDEAVRS
jgi:hypothetical protein